MKLFLVLGLPGSGKTTLSKKISKEMNFFYCGPGELIRKYINENNDAFSNYLSNIYSSGEIIEGEAVDKLFSNINVNKNLHGIVYDGFPRVLSHLDYLNKFINDNAIQKNDIILFIIEIDKEVAKNRILKRFYCEKCKEYSNKNPCPKCGEPNVKRLDDSYLITISRRFENYHKKTVPVIEEISKTCRIIKVDGLLLKGFKLKI